MLNGEGTGVEGPGAGSAPTGAAGELEGGNTSRSSPLLAPKKTLTWDSLFVLLLSPVLKEIEYSGKVTQTLP